MNRVNLFVRRLATTNVRMFTTIDKAEMENMITKSQVFVFDVRWEKHKNDAVMWRYDDFRDPNEVDGGHIEAANFNHIPLEEIDEALALNDSNFKLIYEIKKPQKDDTIVFYCMAGMRAEDAALQFEANGYNKVHLYPGGWKEWVESWTREDWEAWSKETGYPL